MDIATEFLSAISNAFDANKRLADRAVGQVPDDKLHVAPDGNTNSIAVIMTHVAGNLGSRWTERLSGNISAGFCGVLVVERRARWAGRESPQHQVDRADPNH